MIVIQSEGKLQLDGGSMRPAALTLIVSPQSVSQVCFLLSSCQNPDERRCELIKMSMSSSESCFITTWCSEQQVYPAAVVSGASAAENLSGEGCFSPC